MISTSDTLQFKTQRTAWELATFLPCLLIVLALSVPPALSQTDPLARAKALNQEVIRLHQQGRYAEAIPKAREALALRERGLGPTHPDVATSLNNLAVLLQNIGNYAEAQTLCERALRITEAALGPTHPDVATSLNNLANLFRTTGDYAEARPLYERALRIREQALGPTDPLVATSLSNLAGLLAATGDYSGAKSLYGRALHIAEATLGPTHPSVATFLNNLGEVLRATGQYAEARPIYERSLRIYEQSLGPTHPLVATSLNNLALLLEATADYAAARLLFERALHITEAALGPSHPDVARSLGNLADLLKAIGDYTEARPIYERASKILEQVHGPSHPDVATSLNKLANLFHTTGDYAAARLLYERALAIYEQVLGYNHPSVATSLHNLAEISRALGDYTKAQVLHERALTIREAALGPNHQDVAESLNNLALLLKATGDYAAARLLFERALHITEATLGPSHPNAAAVLNNTANLLRATGDYARVRPLYERVVNIYEQSLGPTHPLLATSLNNLAELFQDAGDYTAASPLYERALKIYEQAFGPNHPGVATILNNVAAFRHTAGDYAEAKILYERALKIREQALGPIHPDVAMSLNNLALLLKTTGDYIASRRLYERALRLSDTTLGPSHPDTAVILENLGLAEWEAGRPHDALPRLARAVAITRAHTARGLVGLSNRQKLEFLKTTSLRTDALLSLPFGLVANAEAYRAVLDRKNLLFRTLAAERALVQANADPLVSAILRDYTDVRRQLSALAIAVPDSQTVPQYQTRLATLTQRLETLEGELSRASAVFRQAQAEDTAGLSEVCLAVPADAALIDLVWYLRYAPPAAPGTPPIFSPHYVAFILRGGDCEKPVRLDLGPAAPIDDDVRRFREALSREAPDRAARKLRAQYRQAVAARLKAKLFPPEVQAAMAEKPRLLISPDGALALLPFALLPGDDGHEFFLETRTITYVPSGRDLLRIAPSSSPPTGLLALGAPAFDRATVRLAQATTSRAGCGALDDPFMPLPGTGAEVRAITRVYQQANPTRSTTVLEGTQATKATLMEQAPKAKVLHLATHAYFAGEECTPAGLVSEHRKPGGEPPAFLGHNPLLLAGIALAGANERDKADGILTALEVTALDLRGTDLVVLSACDTGLGTPARGQELLGLRWAFAFAGARNLVTSLWSVPDAETAALMTHFYTALWNKRLSVPAALRAAQLEMLKAARAKGDSAPHAWGAFVVSGRPE